MNLCNNYSVTSLKGRHLARLTSDMVVSVWLIQHAQKGNTVPPPTSLPGGFLNILTFFLDPR